MPAGEDRNEKSILLKFQKTNSKLQIIIILGLKVVCNLLFVVCYFFALTSSNFCAKIIYILIVYQIDYSGARKWQKFAKNVEKNQCLVIMYRFLSEKLTGSFCLICSTRKY